eukprot:CAMPEP_0198123860 /NCGR_PEP_ID=MMETSP1442-20131203/38540_1 /TAXON_ID= /ORGANISM="Craspedostauros australis, Strain CCMP3328" /LENGTH=296 /DNA_ID=CAMNT_0043783139 /DNA_START=36 /DNA_END=926 /DNA_ORIENTATION=-
MVGSGGLSRSESEYIVDGCVNDCRMDGRTREQTRSYTIEFGESSASTEKAPLPLVNGSARLVSVAGETDILCSVKAELVHPALDSPTMGLLEIHVESHRNNRNDELESLLSSLILSRWDGHEQLCIVPKIYVWKVSVDLMIISADGGSALDLCACLIDAALANTSLPKIDVLPGESTARPALQLQSDPRKSQQFPKGSLPSIVTVAVMKNETGRIALVVDATTEEEACAFAMVHFAIDRSDQAPVIVSLAKTGRGALPVTVMQSVTSLAVHTTMSLRRAFRRDDECLLGHALAITT